MVYFVVLVSEIEALDQEAILIIRIRTVICCSEEVTVGQHMLIGLSSTKRINEVFLPLFDS